MRDAIRDLLPAANIVSRPRLSTLSYAGDKKITRLPRRAAIVAFSASDVYAIAELVRRQRGGAAVVLGALSPRTRNAQVALYQNGDVDFLVATDAIGMGLNLDLDHVAFAGLRKFDGQVHRDLTPAELGQIAGRAGRHMNDGTFGVTGQVQPFESELIDRLENHAFDQVGMLQWRTRKLDFASIESLKDSLRQTPDHPRLIRSRMVDDVIALENVSRDAGVRELASGRAGVALLWEMCQIPDYRKISAASHAELVATLYRFVMSDQGKIPADWFARQVALSDRTDGDLDTLSNRLSQIRTWTFVSHRSQWLDDPEHWQDRTRAIEDMLSDALHERLTHRFVDKRTSVLMRRLRDKEELMAEIGADGSILVEDHYVGRLDGFRFTPDTSGDGIHGRAARHASVKVLAHELAARASALAAAGDDAIALKPNGRIAWREWEIARLERGDGPLKPKIQLLADEHLGPAEREQILRRIEAWLASQLDGRLKPLVALSEASDLSGLARGLAFRLAETLGVLRRDAVSSEVKALDQSARAQLRAYGVRFGAFNIYMPALLKPAAADLLLLLWALHAGRNYGLDADALPPRPQQGLTSVEADAKIPEPYWHAAGFQVAGARAIRIDMLERLSDLIRARVSWRQVEGGRGRAIRRHRRWRLSRKPRADERGWLLRRGLRLDPEGARLPARAAEARRSRGFGRSRQRKRPMARWPRTQTRCRQRPSPPSKRSGAPASARMRANPTTLRRGPSRRGGASGNRKRRASASRGHRASSAKSARARQTLRLSPCLPSFAAISPPAARRVTDACTMQGQRLDKWLWCARLVKTRTLAARLIEAGKIRINGERTLKVSRPVRAGDVVTGISAGAGRLFVVRVAGEAERRGPATVARTLYEDLTPVAPAPASNVARGGPRPTKRDRRRLDAIKADDA